MFTYWGLVDEDRGHQFGYWDKRMHAAVNLDNTNQVCWGSKKWVDKCVYHTTRHNNVHGEKSRWVFAHGLDWREKLFKKIREKS